MAVTPPNAYPIKNPDGSWGGNSNYSNNIGAVISGASGVKSFHTRDIFTSLKLEENLDFITDGLTFDQTVYFGNWFRSNYDRIRDYARFEAIRVGDRYVYKQFGANSDFEIGESGRHQWNRRAFNSTLNYNRVSGDNNYSAMLNFDWNENEIDGSEVPYVYSGLSGRINYGYKDKYLAGVSFGFNGSTNFPKKNRYGFFPAVSLAWLMSEEGFLADINVINSFKIKSSFGIVGSDRFGDNRFLYKQFYPGGDKYILGIDGNQSQSTYKEGTIANPNVSWEKSYQINFGINAILFQNSLEWSIDYFNEKRSGVLDKPNSTSPLILGIPLAYTNIGIVKNVGVETVISYLGILNDFTYRVSGNLSYARNKRIKMDEIPRKEEWTIRTGTPVDQPFGLEAIGFYESYEDIENSATSSYGQIKPGDIKYKDQNGDGIINDDDIIPIGFNDIPEIIYGLNFEGGFKGFFLNLGFYGALNRSIYINGENVWAFYNNNSASEMALGRWVYYPEFDLDTRETANYPRLSLENNSNNYRRSTLWTKNGNFLRLKNIQIGYNLSSKYMKRFGLNDISLYITGTNLLTFDHLNGLDPEIPFGYPILKSISFGLDLSF